MFSFKLEGFKEAMEMLDPKKAQQAASSAMNKMLNQTRTAGVKKVTETYNIKRSDITATGTGKARLSVKRATWSNMTATLYITGRPISLSYFGAKQVVGATVRARLGSAIKQGKVSKRMKNAGPLPQGVMVELIRGRKTFMPHAFLATMKNGHIGVFTRHGKARLPILEKSMVSVPSMFSSRPIKEEIQRVISEKWPGIFKHEMTYFMGKKG